MEELRFIFTSPTFITEKTPKAKREFYIPRLSRERSLYGTEFEVKLRNELTQKAIARECAEWIREKVIFKSNITQEQMMGFMTVDESTYMPINGFTTVDLGCERGNNAYYPVQKTESFENANYFLKLFDDLWHDSKKLQEVTDVVIESISAAYKENSPDFIYFFTLYNIFNEFLEDISEDELPNESTGFKQSKIWGMLYNFQRDAVLAIISKLEKFNGCILADSVGLGKTFTALAVIKYYENRNKTVLVLCPKKLTANWNTYKGNYVNNPIAEDRLRYDVLYHTDLSRDHGTSNGIELDRLNWGNYDLVVIDESHNFRNGGEITGEDAKENRYLKLLNRVIRAGVRTKVLMLSATPVNNRFIDLKNQLALAYEGDATQINGKLNTTKSIDEIFRQAQTAFNSWSKLPSDQRTTDTLLKTLDFDFFELLDSLHRRLGIGFRGTPCGSLSGFVGRLGRTGFCLPAFGGVCTLPSFFLLMVLEFSLSCFHQSSFQVLLDGPHVHRGHLEFLKNPIDLGGILCSDHDIHHTVLGVLGLQNTIQHAIAFGLLTENL